MKAILKRFVPEAVLEARRRFLNAKRQRAFQNLSAAQTFTKVYEEGLWGSNGGDDPFCSGDGSHDVQVVITYAEAVERYLHSLGRKPDVVDLGCGDFAVGSRIRPLTGRYVACDVVPGLIERNRAKFAGLDVEFRLLDMVSEELPAGEIAFVRQVFQHLSNAQIEAIVRKLKPVYRVLILTEHLPIAATFVPNVDKLAGPDVRISNASGVVLTAAPFHMRPRAERTLCEVRLERSLIRTTLYEL